MDIAKDDILAWPKRILRSYPHTINDLTIESTLKPYLLKSLDLCFTAFNIFDGKLGLPGGRLVQNHTGDNISRSEIRCIRCLPRPEVPAHKLSLGVHTDFGSMVWYSAQYLAYGCADPRFQTILHPRLGGLQVLPPGSSEWLYVKVRSVVYRRPICSLLRRLHLFNAACTWLHNLQPRRRDGDMEWWNLAV